MPNKIITNLITDPNIQQPWTGPSLNWLQEWNANSLTALWRAIIGDDNYGPGAFALCGMRNTGVLPDVIIAGGFIVYDGELYVCNNFSATLTGANVVIATITTAYDLSIDPVLFTDLVPRNVHQMRTIVLSQGLTGTGDFDYNDMAFVQDLAPVKTKVIPIGNWDMNATANVNVAHGLPTLAKIVNVQASIISDNGAVITFLGSPSTNISPVIDGAFLVDAVQVQLMRVTGGYYDSTAYDTAVYNRGYVTIQYLP